MTHRSAMLAPLVVLLVACSDGSDPLGSGDAARASISFTVPAPGAAASQISAMLVPVTDADGRTIDIQNVQLVLREVELEQSDDDSACDSVEDDDDCEEFETGPALVQLPVNGGVVSPFTTTIPAGIYDELKLKIDGPDDDSGDAAFLASHPSWPRNASVRVQGTYDAGDGTGAHPFDVYLGVDVEIERDLNPPLVVDATTDPGTVNVTIAVDVASWFRYEGGALIDPRLLATNGGLADLVEVNVTRSLDAYEDHDRDGHEEDDD